MKQIANQYTNWTVKVRVKAYIFDLEETKKSENVTPHLVEPNQN